MTSTPPEESLWQTLHHLAGEVGKAADKVDKDRQANEARIAASVRKMRWFRIAGIIGCAASVLALWAGLRANNAVDTLRSQRSESRVIACEKDNDTAGKINALNDRNQGLLRNAVAAGERTPEQQARTDAFLRAELAEYEKIKVPMRKCDPASVDAYYRR